MLLKTKISKHRLHLDPTLNAAYYAAKLGKFTSSEWHHLMGKEGIGKGGMSYIYRKVGEVLSGRPAKDDISVPATEHGLNYERDGLNKFGEKMGLKSMMVQPLVLDEDGYCGGTPDGLIVTGESTDLLSYNVQTVEGKCPYSYDGYIRAWKCKTPKDLMLVNKEWYWQTLHQMYLCGSLVGYFFVYNPFFTAGQINIIEFRKMNLMSDFALIEERKKEAIRIFNDTIKELTQ